MDRISVDLDRRIGPIDRNIFGGFVEHLGRCVYGGIYEPGSPRSDADGFRTDVLEAARRLGISNVRYPGGNFASAYRWMDGVGPPEERATRYDPAWDSIEPNTFGTNEFIAWCRRLGAEPYLVVNCGDGDLREARDWVEYCNGARPTTLTRLRERHGFPAPHGVRYWGVGNEVDGAWQVGFKTPAEYARSYLEFAKVMRWADPRSSSWRRPSRIGTGRSWSGPNCSWKRPPTTSTTCRSTGTSATTRVTCPPTSRSPRSSRTGCPPWRDCRGR